MTSDPPESIELVATQRQTHAAPRCFAQAIRAVLLPGLLLLAMVATASPRGAAAATDGSTSDAVIAEPGQEAEAAADPGAAQRAAPATGSPAENDPDRQCEVPAELSPAPDPLPGLSRALKNHDAPLKIVVLGSLSSGAKGRATGVAGFPARLQARLESDLASRGLGVPVQVEMVGRSRALAGELAALIERRVLPMKPTLVIWQVGRADARQGNPPYRFGKRLAEGLDTLQEQQIDTIVADIQFHPQFEALYRTDDYRDYVRWLTGKRDLPLLHRYEMIEYWAMSGLIDLDSGNDADQQAAYEFIQTCVAYQAARMILSGAGLAR